MLYECLPVTEMHINIHKRFEDVHNKAHNWNGQERTRKSGFTWNCFNFFFTFCGWKKLNAGGKKYMRRGLRTNSFFFGLTMMFYIANFPWHQNYDTHDHDYDKLWFLPRSFPSCVVTRTSWCCYWTGSTVHSCGPTTVYYRAWCGLYPSWHSGRRTKCWHSSTTSNPTLTLPSRCIHFNSFAANFLTCMFSQCHIILKVKGVMPYEASTFSKNLVLQFLLSVTFYKYLKSKSDLSKLKTPWRQQNVCK